MPAPPDLTVPDPTSRPSGITDADVPETADLEDEKEDEASTVEEMARKQFGLRTWERPALYRETADAGTDTDVPFFAVLFLSGAIATLGLVLNSTAVVIGAMLVAPLLGPLLGLSMALAVGDGRLFVQTAAAVLVGAAGIVALAAALTAVLPFQMVTDEIASRTQPTTLDLAIAVCSGLAGAVVTASREKRLSASIPGVAVAVALVPPLGVAGFGIATGKWAFTKGALLLFGANLAGIVLSGMTVFILVGMHRHDVAEAARTWHSKGHATGLAARISNVHWLDRLPGMNSAKARFLLVAAFMGIVAVPLTTSLSEFVRENKISAAVSAVERSIEDDDDAFVIDRETQTSTEPTTVRLRVATKQWITRDEIAELNTMLEKQAEEPVTLSIEQLLASSGDLEAFAQALPSRPAVRSAPATPTPEPVPVTVAALRGRLTGVLEGLVLPDSVRIVGGTLEVGTQGGGPVLEVAYGAERRLNRDAEAMIARQAAQALDLEASDARAVAVSLRLRSLPDSLAAGPLARVLTRFPRLQLALAGDTVAVRAARQRMIASGAPADRVRALPDTLQSRARLVIVSDSTSRP